MCLTDRHLSLVLITRHRMAGFFKECEMDFQMYMTQQSICIHDIAVAFKISDNEAAAFWCESGLAAEYAESVK